MQNTKSRLAGIQKVTFGTTASTRHRITGGISATVIPSCLAYQLSHGPLLLALLIPSALVAIGTLVNLTNRNLLEIDFAANLYFLETGSWPAVKVTGGRLSEISHLSITRILQPEAITYAAYIVFHPEIKQSPYRLDLPVCSVPTGGFGDRFPLLLELATRLNIPVYDDSGWNGRRPDFSEPKLIIVQPGEIHPALRHKPQRNKW